MSTIADMVPGLAEGYERRQRLATACARSRRVSGTVELTIVWEFLARRYGAAEAVEIMAHGGWRGWASRVARESGSPNGSPADNA